MRIYMASRKRAEAEKAIRSRRLQDALLLAEEAVVEADSDDDCKEALRLRAQVFARLQRPSDGARDLVEILERGLGDIDDVFTAALYYLREDNFELANGVIATYESHGLSNDWYSEELKFLTAYCALKLGDDKTAAAVAATLPDDIEMIIKPLARPLRKTDLVRKVAG